MSVETRVEMAPPSPDGRVLVVGIMPPPMNGMAFVTRRIRDQLARRKLLLDETNLSVPEGKGGLQQHIAKALRVLAGAGQMLRHAGKKGRWVYMPSDARSGKIYTLFLATVARVLGYRIALHHHSYFYINNPSGLMGAICRVMRGRGVHLLLCCCMADDFARVYAKSGPVETFVLHNEAIFPSEAMDKPLPNGTMTLGHFGNLTWEKGAGRFLDLFERLHGAGANVRAKLAGDPMDPGLAERISDCQAKYGAAFEFQPNPSRPYKDDFFRTIDFFVFPSQYKVEAQPLVLIEARAAGAPVISTDLGCIRGDHEGGPNLIVSKHADFAAEAADWLLSGRFAAQPRGSAATHRGADYERFFELFA